MQKETLSLPKPRVPVPGSGGTFWRSSETKHPLFMPPEVTRYLLAMLSALTVVGAAAIAVTTLAIFIPFRDATNTRLQRAENLLRVYAGTSVTLFGCD